MESVLPDDQSEASKLKAKAYEYYIHEESLNKKGKEGPNLKCITKAKSLKVLQVYTREYMDYIQGENHWLMARGTSGHI